MSGKFDAESVQKRDTDTRRTKTYHSKRDSSTSTASGDLEATGKPTATKSSGDSEDSKAGSRKWPVSSICTSHEESLFDRTANLRPMSNG